MTSENASKELQKLDMDGFRLKQVETLFLKEKKYCLKPLSKKEDKDQPRIRGQLPTCIDDNGVPNIELTLQELEKSIAAGLNEVEVFPINFVPSA